MAMDRRGDARGVAEGVIAICGVVRVVVGGLLGLGSWSVCPQWLSCLGSEDYGTHNGNVDFLLVLRHRGRRRLNLSPAAGNQYGNSPLGGRQQGATCSREKLKGGGGGGKECSPKASRKSCLKAEAVASLFNFQRARRTERGGVWHRLSSVRNRIMLGSRLSRESSRFAGELHPPTTVLAGHTQGKKTVIPGSTPHQQDPPLPLIP